MDNKYSLELLDDLDVTEIDRERGGIGYLQNSIDDKWCKE